MEQDFSAIQNNLKQFSNILHSCGVEFWLEAGSVLAAYRDGKIFPWEHDVDVAVWFDDLDKVRCAVEKLRAQGYRVRVQKDFPYIDNIIQVYVPPLPDGSEPLPNQYDIYLYRHFKDKAIMRWIHQPTGRLSKFRKTLVWLARDLAVTAPHPSKWWIKVGITLPHKFRQFIFSVILKWHIATGKCIYHVHPARFFTTLTTLDFYGLPFKLPSDTEEFLVHRYGSNWKNPDPQFNQTGKWKKSEARKEMRLNLLPYPELNFNLPYAS